MIIRTLMESKKQFIVANTTSSSVAEMKQEHIIPVFAKDHEVAIAHYELVQQTYDAVQMYFGVSDSMVKTIEVSRDKIIAFLNVRKEEEVIILF